MNASVAIFPIVIVDPYLSDRLSVRLVVYMSTTET
jgi:hypothetical protein